MVVVAMGVVHSGPPFLELDLASSKCFEHEPVGLNIPLNLGI